VKIFKTNALPLCSIVLFTCTVTILLIVLGEKEVMEVVSSKPLSVKTFSVQKTDYTIQIPAWGFVEPTETVAISAEIPGQVMYVPNEIFTGATVTENMLLFSIDDRNYQNLLQEAKGAKSLAEQALEIEKGRQIIAQKEWELLENLSWNGTKNKLLALRKPQLKEREAALRIAEAKEDQARLNVERTQITAPCNGVILTENLARGRLLDTGDVGAQVGCTDSYQIAVLFSPEYSIGSETDKVVVIVDSVQYEGKIKSILPQINPQTRQKQALIEIPGLQVVLGSYAKVILPGTFYENMAVLPNSALRANNTVWLLDKKGSLEIRSVEVLEQDMRNVIISNGIAETDIIVLSHIASPLVGMQLSMLSQ
jgi:RND family efflux transporter MFP subunit